VRSELSISKDRLEQLIGESVDTVSYPFGYTSSRVSRIARDLGYRSGCTVGRAVAHGHPLLALPRLQILPTTSEAGLLRLVERGEPGIKPPLKRTLAPAWRIARLSAEKVGAKSWS
jgi:peptidoglycan/xylan/chitin deacetylase (PgdA/CDA1 family)